MTANPTMSKTAFILVPLRPDPAKGLRGGVREPFGHTPQTSGLSVFGVTQRRPTLVIVLRPARGLPLKTV